MCGAGELEGILAKIGYTKDQVCHAGTLFIEYIFTPWSQVASKPPLLIPGFSVVTVAGVQVLATLANSVLSPSISYIIIDSPLVWPSLLHQGLISWSMGS